MIRFEPVDPRHPDALALLHEAALEARALYPELFAADTPLPSNPPAEPRSLYLLARDADGRALACGALRPIDEHTAELRRMFVTRGERRRGLARAVLQQLEAAAPALGYRTLRLETGFRQRPAMALYQACGWRPIEPFGAHADDPASRCFEKVLSVSASIT
ncbi:GNAT family N-acetyltransferase [Aquabacterium humicola]|uniref:GNAT family N-acetyltransferase n=1 Tax=Aquabacterium humicola TaxID=3237377 RepID=UPI0025434C83|nr:GNAT family N-acetyltransferase [Rubrivivax pictus]